MTVGETLVKVLSHTYCIFGHDIDNNNNRNGSGSEAVLKSFWCVVRGTFCAPAARDVHLTASEVIVRE